MTTIKKIAATVLFAAIGAQIHARIDLNLSQKPAKTGSYAWSKRRAKQLVERNKDRLLTIIGTSKNAYKNIQNRTKDRYDFTMTTVQVPAFFHDKPTGTLPTSIQQSIYSFFDNRYVREKIGFRRIWNNGPIIMVETKKFGIIQIFRNDTVNSPAAATNTKKIFLSVPQITQLGYSHIEIEATVGHELAHIICQHSFDAYCIKTLYEERQNHINRQQYDRALQAYDKATEVQADIVGTFNNVTLATAGATIFGRIGYNPWITENTSKHPTSLNRALYLNELSQAMAGEKKTTKVSVSKNQRKNRTDRNTNKPTTGKKRALKKKGHIRKKSESFLGTLLFGTPKRTAITALSTICGYLYLKHKIKSAIGL